MTMRSGSTSQRLLAATLLICSGGLVVAQANGDITLAQATNLFGREPTRMRVDIIPGDADNVVRSSAGRAIQVAILGSDEVDINSINPRTIRLKGVDVMLVGKSDKSLCKSQDIDADDRPDLVCEVRTTGFMVGEGEFTIVLEAATYKGESLRGEDRIRIVRD